MGCATNCSTAKVQRNYLFDTSWSLHHRTGWNGLYGVHGGTHSEWFDSNFHEQVGLGFAGFNHFSFYWGRGSIDWIGDVGAYGCKPGCHSQGRAIDVTAVRLYQSGAVIDMNVAWRGTTTEKKEYLAVWAGLRRDVGTVLSNSYNSAHRCHFHADNGVSAPTLRQSAKTDTLLTQRACNLLDGAGIAEDGIWGSQTEAAYGSLLTSLGLAGRNPKTNAWHMILFLEAIMKEAVNQW